MNKILIIQTAFIGDVILATVLIEKLHQYFPEAQIDFLLRKGNENLLQNHPKLNKVLIWNKKHQKYKSLRQTIVQIRKEKYDLVVNTQRFTSTGLITAYSGAKQKIGFDKNPLSFMFSQKIKHKIKEGEHEVNRNLSLISSFTDDKLIRPKLYPSDTDFEQVSQYKKQDYICIAPTSVWFTKQFPAQQWIKLINQLQEFRIYLLGSPSDKNACQEIMNQSTHQNINNLAGELSLLASAALMQDAQMNYVNDSAPLHLCSSMNAPVTAIFCSTIPDFGFTPLSEKSLVVEVQKKLTCRPCGLHGKKECPQGHFDCAYQIETKQLLHHI